MDKPHKRMIGLAMPPGLIKDIKLLAFLLEGGNVSRLVSKKMRDVVDAEKIRLEIGPGKLRETLLDAAEASGFDSRQFDSANK